jgi:hypothetical protein
VIDHWPWRQIVRHHPPLVAGLHDVAQPVEHNTARSECSRCGAAPDTALQTPTPHRLRHSDSLPASCSLSLHAGEKSVIRKESTLVQVHSRL